MPTLLCYGMERRLEFWTKGVITKGNHLYTEERKEVWTGTSISRQVLMK